MEMFDKLGGAYGGFVDKDPMRKMHYAAVIGKIYAAGVRSRLRVLDAGCGNGALPRILADEPYAADVTGFDSSASYIAEAEARERENPLGIRYACAAAHEFRAEIPQEAGCSVMVLPYAPDAAYLRQFFRAAYASLLEDAAFHSVVFRPGFAAFGGRVANRRFTRENAHGVQVDFLDPETGTKQFDSHLTQYSVAQYEDAAAGEGFREAIWSPLHPDPALLDRYGKPFWDPCVTEQPYALLSVRK
jgi:SAM-dependent methyltransferase